MALPPLLCMQEAPHYRRQAQRARWLARQLTDPSDMETMHGLANDLDEIAIDLENIGLCLIGLGRANEAITILDRAINLARESLDQYFSGAIGYGIGREDQQPDTYPALSSVDW